MKLKSISIIGFKTFADRVNLHFNDGITGVIGPNGSGKSNMIAAVRWVMGEQTAKNLRDPSEIIFAGAQERKPLNMAEVILNFTNDGTGCPPEFMHLPEISIGRRIYRDGEREYFMNKEPCRLRDIIDFLLAIGLGARSYSIIEQEKRDRIIQASPDDLREILEETAGISIFKQHRHEAEKRLLSTADKMKSIEEIEAELMMQSNNLKEQVEKAKQKQLLQGEQKEKEIGIICYRVGLFRGIAQKLRDEIHSVKTEVQQNVIDSTEWEVEANENKAEQLEIKLNIKDVEDKLEDKKIALTKYQERKESYKKRSEDRVKRKITLNNTLKDEQEALTREQERLFICQDELDNSEKMLKKLDIEIEEFQYRIDENDEGLQVDKIKFEELRSEIRALHDLLSTLRAKNEALLERIEKNNYSLIKIEELLSDGEKNKNVLVLDKKDLSEQLEKLSQGMVEISEQKLIFDQKIKDFNFSLEQAQINKNAAKEKLIEISTNLLALQKLLNSNEGLSDGTKILKTKLNHYLLGFVFENININKEDEILLEKYLPDLLETAIVENQDKLLDILDKAEELDISRVFFIIPELCVNLSLDEKKLQEKLNTFNGVRNIAGNLNTKYLAIENIFSRIFYVRDEWLIFKILREYGEITRNFMFITERGTIINYAKEIVFGKKANVENTGILQRKREIFDLEKQKGELQQILANSESLVYSLTQEKKTVESYLFEIEEKISSEKVEILKITNQTDILVLKIKNCNDNILRLENDKLQILTELTKDKEQFAIVQSKIEENERELKIFNQEFAELEENYSEKQEIKNELVTQYQHKKSEKTVFAERGQNYRRNYEELKYHITRLQNNLDKTIAELRELNDTLSQSDVDEVKLDAEIKILKTNILELEFNLEEASQNEASIMERLKVLENKIKMQKDKFANKEKILNEKGMELARCETVLTTAEKEANERFFLAPTDLPLNSTEIANYEEKLEKEINKLKKQIEEIGPVNERALDEYNNVEERRKFLEEQKYDIERSVNELQKAIMDIEETTKIRFKDIYDKVNNEFIKLFPILFPGGEAQLNLLNANELLTTGVEILVRLPGKRPQRMHLFSGGEKALTAISLIFALLKTHPAPFCFLDEVDAPLDEANVGRFNNVLDSLSNDFQFVVITHNRRTMEVLDTIYGISMQEPGVSKLVSVDLSDVPENLRKKTKMAINATHVKTKNI